MDKQRLERMQVLRSQGWSTTRIGADLGVNHSTIVRALQKAARINAQEGLQPTQVDYSKDFVRFFADLYVVEGAYGPRPIIPPFLRTWLRACFPLPSGDPAVRNVGDFRTKKEGKSALAGAVALYMATRKADSEVIIAASDVDQAKDRVLRAVKYALEHGPLAGHAKVYRDIIELDNHSFIQAIPADWKGAAGGNPCAVIFDELHAWTWESQRRLYDELIIPPTINAGVRWGASYAGWIGESLLLEELWAKALAGRQQVSDLPIYQNDDASLLAFVDVGEASWRMPWMTSEYIQQTQASERPNTFKRLWLNTWVSGEGEYLPVGAWAACFDENLRPVRPDERLPMVLGIDAATSSDHAGIVATIWNDQAQTIDVKFAKEWIPKRGFLRGGKPTIDLAETVGAEVLRMHQAGQIRKILCDPYQLHNLLIEWQKLGICVEEFSQTTRRTESDTSLFNIVTSRSIRHYGDKDLTQHINNCAALEGPRGMRIGKGGAASQKIDLAICLSMSAYGATSGKYGISVMTAIPDPFECSREELRLWAIHQGPHTATHPPGITHENCRKRNRGCPACIAEYEREGFFRDERAASPVEQDTGPYVTAEDERREKDIFYEDVRRRRFDQELRQAQEPSNEHIKIFWDSIRRIE